MPYDSDDDESAEQARRKAEWEMDFKAVKKLAADLLDTHGWAGCYTVKNDLTIRDPYPRLVSCFLFKGSDQMLTIKQPSMDWFCQGEMADEREGTIRSSQTSMEYSYLNIDAVFQKVIGAFAIVGPPSTAAQNSMVDRYTAITDSVQTSDDHIRALAIEVRQRGRVVAQAHGGVSIKKADELLLRELLRRMELSFAS
jgi:hypothetical protein